MAEMKSLPQRLKTWITSRPKLNMNESTTWFLLVFVWAHGLTIDELDFQFSGISPQPSTSLLVLIVILFCLVMATMLTMEPLLPCKLRRRTKLVRHSGVYRGVLLGSMIPAFVLGWLAGFNMIIDTVPELSWLISVVFFVGFGIFIVLVVRMVLGRA